MTLKSSSPACPRPSRSPRTPSPTEVNEPGADAVFSVSIENTSDPEPAVVAAGAPAEVAILAALLLVQPETIMQIATDTSDPLESGTSLAELVRAFVRFLAASIPAGGLFFAVMRRARV